MGVRVNELVNNNIFSGHYYSFISTDDVVYLHKLPDDFAVDYQRSVMSKLSVQKAISKDGGEDNYGGDEKDDEEGEEKEEKQEDLDKPDDEDEEEGGRTETNDEEEPVPEGGI